MSAKTTGLAECVERDFRPAAACSGTADFDGWQVLTSLPARGTVLETMSSSLPPHVVAVRQRVRESAQTTRASGLDTLVFRAMSTACRIAVPASGESAKFFAEVLTWVADFEAKYSRFIPESLIGRINAAAGGDWVAVDEETERLLQLCQDLFALTRGAFDASALPLLQLWNWKASPPTIPTAEQIAVARELVGWRRVERRPGAVRLPCAGMGLDFGGLGKEYAVDCVVDMVQARGFAAGLVDFGADVRVFGSPPDRPLWHIGLEDPHRPGACWCGLGVRDQAVATSGDYLRHFVVQGKRYGHILDPRTGLPLDNGCRAVSAIAPTCLIAGFLSTTAFVLGAQEGLRLIENHPGAAGAITTDASRFESRLFRHYVASEEGTARRT